MIFSKKKKKPFPSFPFHKLKGFYHHSPWSSSIDYVLWLYPWRESSVLLEWLSRIRKSADPSFKHIKIKINLHNLQHFFSRLAGNWKGPKKNNERMIGQTSDEGGRRFSTTRRLRRYRDRFLYLSINSGIKKKDLFTSTTPKCIHPPLDQNFYILSLFLHYSESPFPWRKNLDFRFHISMPRTLSDLIKISLLD